MIETTAKLVYKVLMSLLWLLPLGGLVYLTTQAHDILEAVSPVPLILGLAALMLTFVCVVKVCDIWSGRN